MTVYGSVATGKTRVVILGWGESGMSGRGTYLTNLPSGYPPFDDSLWVCGDPYIQPFRPTPWQRLNEPTDQVNVWAQDIALKETNPAVVGSGWGGLFCWKLQQQLGSGYEVGFVQCGKGSSTLADWATSGYLFKNTVSRANKALAINRCILGGIILDLGLNDALAASTPPWTADATTIETALRAQVTGAANVPVYFRKSQSQTAYTGLVSLRSQQDSWETLTAPKRVKLVYDSTVQYIDADHLNTTGNIALADVALTAWTAHPGRTS